MQSLLLSGSISSAPGSQPPASGAATGRASESGLFSGLVRTSEAAAASNPAQAGAGKSGSNKANGASNTGPGSESTAANGSAPSPETGSEPGTNGMMTSLGEAGGTEAGYAVQGNDPQGLAGDTSGMLVAEPAVGEALSAEAGLTFGLQVVQSDVAPAVGALATIDPGTAGSGNRTAMTSAGTAIPTLQEQGGAAVNNPGAQTDSANPSDPLPLGEAPAGQTSTDAELAELFQKSVTTDPAAASKLAKPGENVASLQASTAGTPTGDPQSTPQAVLKAAASASTGQQNAASPASQSLSQPAAQTQANPVPAAAQASPEVQPQALAQQQSQSAAQSPIASAPGAQLAQRTERSATATAANSTSTTAQSAQVSSPATANPALATTPNSALPDVRPAEPVLQALNPAPASAPPADLAMQSQVFADGAHQAGFEGELTLTRSAGAAGSERAQADLPRFTAQSAQQLAAQITKRFNNGNRVFDIRLDPAELGRVDVRLEMTGDNRVQAVLTVERADTLAELQRAARDLERALNEAGLDLDSDGLSFQLSEDADEGSTRQDGEDSIPVFGGDDVITADGEPGPLAEARTEYGFRLAPARDRVDVFI